MRFINLQYCYLIGQFKLVMVQVFLLYCCSFVMIMTLINPGPSQMHVHSVNKAYVNNRRLSCDCRFFFKVTIWLFHFVSRSFQAVEVTLKGCILYSLIIFSVFLCELLLFTRNKYYLSSENMHAFIPDICSTESQLLFFSHSLPFLSVI